MSTQVSSRESATDEMIESVFVRPRLLPGERPNDRPARLRDDVRQEALEAAAKVLRSRKPLPRAALDAVIEAIHSPPHNLTPAEAAIEALRTYKQSYPAE